MTEDQLGNAIMTGDQLDTAILQWCDMMIGRSDTCLKLLGYHPFNDVDYELTQDALEFYGLTSDGVNLSGF